jgi:hypothetical protein
VVASTGKLTTPILNKQVYLEPFKAEILKHSSVGIATRTRAGEPGFKCRQGQEIFLFPITSIPALRPTQIPIQRVPGDASSGVKRPGCEADHSPPSSSEVKNGGAVSPLLHTSSWHGV